mgnify:CR=1 FL=1
MRSSRGSSAQRDVPRAAGHGEEIYPSSPPKIKSGVPGTCARSQPTRMSPVTSAAEEPPVPRHEFRSFLRWYRPFLTGSWGLLAWTGLGIVIVLTCQALIPLEVERILDDGEWDPKGLTGLVVMIIVVLVVGHFMNIGADMVGWRSAVKMREGIFRKLTSTPALFMRGLGRSSVVSRHTSDVDNISDAVEGTLAEGIPGAARLIISLVLLYTLEPGVCLVMTIATIVFLLVRSRVGKGLLQADKARMAASTHVGQNVDETISSARGLVGLGLLPWARGRFDEATEHLAHKTHAQGNKAVQLATGANGAGMLGLLAVVVFATIGGHDNMSSAAASLLYVEGVVRGLESLPPWLRSVHLAVASQQRIDEILLADDVDVELLDADALDHVGLAREELLNSSARTVGAVTTADIDPDVALAALTRGTDYDHLPADPIIVDASPLEYLQAGDPTITPDRAREVLASVGLDRLADNLTESVGPSGMSLNTPDRQRLALAIAMSRTPRLLAIGPIAALGDPDTAAPLISLLRSDDSLISVIASRSPDVARQMDAMVFIDNARTVVGSHQDLLVNEPGYARIWEQRLRADDVDLGDLGLNADTERVLQTRLVTERYLQGESIYREGDAADRVVFIISGDVEIMTEGRDGSTRRAAVLGPGSHCGDLRLTVSEKRAETAIALTDTVVRTLSREAVSAGAMGLLDRPPAQRRIVSSILRDGAADRAQLHDRFTDTPSEEVDAALDTLLAEGAVREVDGQFQAAHKRVVKKGARELLDRLADL